MYKYIITLDKLIVSLKINDSETFNYNYIQDNYKYRGNTYTLSPQLELRKNNHHQEPYYLNSFDLWAEGDKIGQLHTDCTRPQVLETVKFQFENWIHYTGRGFTYYLNLLSDIDLWVETISYFEVAFDAHFLRPLMPRLSNIERHSTMDEYNPFPKYKPLSKVLISKLHNGSQYVFGKSATSSSGKQIAVYNKTKQLGDLKGKGKAKDHITAFHAANGFNMEKDIERIEARISNAWLVANGVSITAEDLVNPSILLTLFLKAVADVLKFRNMQAHGGYDTNRNYKPKVIDLLPLQALKAHAVELPQRLATTASGISDSKKRITLKTLVHQFVATGNAETAAAIRHFRNTNTAPKNADWDMLIGRYAQSYDGNPTAESKERIAQIHSLLIVTNKSTLPYEKR